MNIKDELVRLGKQFPPKQQKLADEMLQAAGEKIDGATFLGSLLVSSIILFILFILIFTYIPQLNNFLSTISSEISIKHEKLLFGILNILTSFVIIILLNLFIISYLSLKADSRRTALESMLPDFLSLVSSNVRSGMPLDQALWQAGKPEFGVLGKETKEAVKEAFSGKPLEKALIDLGNKFNSMLFRRILKILTQSIKSGGEVAVVLEETANEARETFIVKRDIRANLLVYIIFLFFAAAIGVPFLFAVSQKMLEVLVSAFSLTQNIGSAASSTFTVSRPPIEPEHFYYFSLLTIFISTVISALIIGATYSGNKLDGLKYLPFMIIIAYVIFFVAIKFLSAFFQGFIV